MSKRAFTSLFERNRSLDTKEKKPETLHLAYFQSKITAFFLRPPRLLLEISEAKTGRRYNSRNFSVTLQRLIINKVEWILSTM